MKLDPALSRFVRSESPNRHGGDHFVPLWRNMRLLRSYDRVHSTATSLRPHVIPECPDRLSWTLGNDPAFPDKSEVLTDWVPTG